MKIGDTSFGLTTQSLALLAMLAGDDLDSIFSHRPADDANARKWETHTYPMYNGRERGVCITFGTWVTDKPVLHIFFTESRNSDSLHVWKWHAEQPFNAPVLSADPLVYSNKKSFAFGHIGEAWTYIIGLLRDEVEA